MSLIIRASAPTLTRPSNTDAYTAGDLVANSETAGSVTNRIFSFGRFSGHLAIWSAILRKSQASATNAAFLLHLFGVAPTYTSAGDNSAISSVLVASAKEYLGTLSFASSYAASDVGFARAIPAAGTTPVLWQPKWTAGANVASLYGVLVANGAYTPASAETFDIEVQGTAEHQSG